VVGAEVEPEILLGATVVDADDTSLAAKPKRSEGEDPWTSPERALEQYAKECAGHCSFDRTNGACSAGYRPHEPGSQRTSASSSAQETSMKMSPQDGEDDER